MQITYTPKAKEHLDFWVKSGNKAVLKKIVQLTKSILETPYEGEGKPEQLKHELTGYWSRRITIEHRFVYTIVSDTLIVASLKGHYEQ
jgi:toxin YoeB